MLTRAEWLAALEQAGGRDVTNKVVALIDTGGADPKVAMADLLAAAGVPYTLGPGGTPQLR